MASKNSIALDEEMKGEVVVVAMKEVYKEKGIPCCPGSETGSGKAVYCIKGKNESDAYVTERTKFLDRVHFLIVFHDKFLKTLSDAGRCGKERCQFFLCIKALQHQKQFLLLQQMHMFTK